MSMFQQGIRQYVGQRNPSSVLSESDVIEIKKKIRADVSSLSALGREYGVSEKTIRNIRDGQTWKHVMIDNEVQVRVSSALVNALSAIKTPVILTESDLERLRDSLVDSLKSRGVRLIVSSPVLDKVLDDERFKVAVRNAESKYRKTVLETPIKGLD